MRVIPTAIPDVLRIELSSHDDVRGRFLRVFDAVAYAGHGIAGPFEQENVSTSGPDVLRGLHFQRDQPQGKLLTVVAGAIMDVAVDLRPESGAFGRWVSVELTAEQPAQVWVPPGFAHGFCVVRAPAVVVYRTTAAHDPEDQWGIRWDDPDLAIPWPVRAPVLSPRDQALPTLMDLKSGGFFAER
jgi:dTDP-4-dehydrorhamnose 3,5-epimerase